MDVLIAAASRHGATRGIADRLAQVLSGRGCHVDVVDIEPTRWLDDEHDAYVVGSAVYMDRWERDARRFLEVNRSILDRHPLWLFSSGPLEHTSAADDATKPSTGSAPLGERDHRVFGGKLDRAELGPVEAVVTKLVGARPGDYRTWTEIEAWANGIADELLGDESGESVVMHQPEEAS